MALRAIHYGTELADTLKKHSSWIYLHAKSLHPYKMLFFGLLFFFSYSCYWNTDNLITVF